MNLLHPTTLPACFVFTVATQILNLKWISKFWHFSFHGVCYSMILCWLESAWFRLFYWLRKASTFSIVVSWLPFKRFLVLIDYSKGTDWKQLLLLEMSECFSRWAALVGVAIFWVASINPGGTQESFIQGGFFPRSNHLPFYIPISTEQVPFRRPSIDKWYLFHIPSLELFIPLNCCKHTVFEIWINHKTTTFSRRFSLQPKMQLLALLGLSTDRNDRFPTLSHTSTSEITTLSYSSKPKIGTPFGWSLSV